MYESILFPVSQPISIRKHRSILNFYEGELPILVGRIETFCSPESSGHFLNKQETPVILDVHFLS